MREIIIESLDKIAKSAELFLELLGEKRVIAFYGSMGAGKTTFIKSICECLGVNETVNSPTFAIINVYQGSDCDEIYHFDCYRINSDKEAEDLDLGTYFYSGNWCFIEWPENIEKFLPEDAVRVNIKAEIEGKRIVTIEE
ncbi:MAG: tRNA (adenosine(37)-N6)-threonylcarbamoyltransferase complex ATPase subunit type 1 TsaE [Paludibacteraceae bacterium]|nr:tRNA (adenosine(37)-N6)-threonylcarbamoyltransferase complex ATPase subunit type 1 TsaE [Paludibacteraceae bacterium]